LENNALQVNNDVSSQERLNPTTLTSVLEKTGSTMEPFFPERRRLNSSDQRMASSGGNFHKLLFSGSGTKTAMMAMTVAGNLGITDNFNGGSYLHNLYGNWTNDGTYSPSTPRWCWAGPRSNPWRDQPNTFYSLDIDNASGII
jgi:hypothetical protein